ncbi:DUF1707 SHOCT-like domain-containing protein [Thermasporomyces composti]|jgi:hypothetical protein|uniref:Uncharacterized protein DUF1707 n=1 Tax=Thermasporomyces composti TaxID=696763 RepID=A0A3D9VE30_THECX|nr:DUF1707 domain-containing protein [Thermasporomyces composti]REF37345.1 uncharacterized protein DUF1707 [Thermasporomyces composti]
MTVPYQPDMRASDSDREKIAARLRDAHAEGRLTLTEFQDRLEALYKAQTYGELEPLVRDIPVVRTPHPSTEVSKGSTTPAKPPRSRGDKVMVVLWTLWACAVSVNLVVWVLTGITNGELPYFWPAWVAGPWGAVLLSITIMRRQLRD